MKTCLFFLNLAIWLASFLPLLVTMLLYWEILATVTGIMRLYNYQGFIYRSWTFDVVVLLWLCQTKYVNHWLSADILQPTMIKGWFLKFLLFYSSFIAYFKNRPLCSKFIECVGWRRHSSLIFLILLFTKPNIEASGWLYHTKNTYHSPFSRVTPPNYIALNKFF